MQDHRDHGYKPIGDYGIIGDCHTAALVSKDGSIDWCCWPRFDSPAIFCRLLDRLKGGWTSITPASGFETERVYLDDTNVLTTNFKTHNGSCRLTDFMPIEHKPKNGGGDDVATGHYVLRLVEGLSGSVDINIEFNPTFDYAAGDKSVEVTPNGLLAIGTDLRLEFGSPARLSLDKRGIFSGRLTVNKGDRFWFTLQFADSKSKLKMLTADECDGFLEATIKTWKNWIEKCRYKGEYAEMVRRSALTLKLLTFEPTGALVAAPTTSLPEWIGGIRNWDYRYTWLRDSSLILYTLQLLGYHDEADDFFRWLEKICIPCGHELQIMYRIDDNASLDEKILDYLDGYRGSRPVRIGNAAHRQRQLDVYGEVIDAAFIFHNRSEGTISEDLKSLLVYLADQTVERWKEPDNGIWEVRGGPRHFLYSKLMCWVALDRMVRMFEDGGHASLSKWSAARDEIRNLILTKGYNSEIGAFTQSIGNPELDASALIIPQVGFLPQTDARVISTVDHINRKLTANRIVYRYSAPDGLPGDEGAFLLCTFWLVDCLALSGHVDEAKRLFEHTISFCNDLGLLSEEIDPRNGELLGNFPQGFTHLGLVRSALNIAKAEKFGPEHEAEDQTTRANRIEHSR